MNDKLYLIMVPCMCLIGVVSGLYINNSVYGLALGMILSAIFSFPFFFKYESYNDGSVEGE